MTSWDHKLDEWLNADIMHTPGRGPLKDPMALRAVVEAVDLRTEGSHGSASRRDHAPCQPFSAASSASTNIAATSKPAWSWISWKQVGLVTLISVT